jgi:alpha-L-rhamnosidase
MYKIITLALNIFFLSLQMKVYSAEAQNSAPIFLWNNVASEGLPVDQHVGFRGSFNLTNDAEVEFRLLGASWFSCWLDETYFAEGPARFSPAYPHYQTYRSALKAGKHLLAFQLHHTGIPSRMMENQLPFLYAKAFINGQEIILNWKCQSLDGYKAQAQRVNPQLGWSEWCDTRLIPEWQKKAYDDSSWAIPVVVTRPLGEMTPLASANPKSIDHSVKQIASGELVELFGYETDNPAARFFLRDLEAKNHPPQGVWRRYDLGRVRLAKPRFQLDLPAGSVVEFAYSEYLIHDRVSPWITLSGGNSCNFDHYIARGGLQEFSPLTPKGGRFMEVHIIAPPSQVRFISEQVVERCYYGDAEGSFKTDDELLNRIWSVGVETHKACSEDALTDNPTRERGQWTGDVVTVGMDIAGVAFNDLRMCRRGLVQAAQCARADGLVAGMSPGQSIFLSTFAAQWLTACVHYWELTGEKALLEELFPAAEKNLEAFENKRNADGLQDSLGWGFVDWGYVRNSGPSDMGVNLHYLAAIRDMKRWCVTLGYMEKVLQYEKINQALTELIANYFALELKPEAGGWSAIGYHRAALGLRLGFFKEENERQCVNFLKAHILSCFPNDISAPRLSDPSANNSRLITPYFAHFAMPLLIERGEFDFVLDQYRKCWGWSLEDCRTTWLEVFDTRWSHAHQWAGCPTWQLSRYALGLHARQDLGANHFKLILPSSSLMKAQGTIPIHGTNAVISVSWEKIVGGLKYRVETPVAITIHILDKTAPDKEKTVSIEKVFEEIMTFKN